MIRKKIDSRVRTIVENGVNLRHRTMFVIVGDRGRDQIVNLHYMLTKAQTKARPSVLWCYKKELGFTTHKHKRMREVKRKIQRGQAEAGKEDPFDLFISSTDIRYTYYSDTQKILGNTYGMCVLQDFEALTPNLLARTVETVEGGGLIVLLLRTMKSLKQLYTLSMDVHGRFRTESHADVQPRFNERFILSLATCQTCLVVDDALNVLPISSHCLSIEPVANAPETREETKRAAELRDLKVAMADTQPAGALVSTARTMDQAKAILTFVEAISEKTLRSTVTLTAARGRGKSAALGVAMAAAVAYGYSNIFVTSPSPENLKTLFEFVCKGFDALDMQEHTHYELVQSTNPELNKAVIRINVFRTHRQTIHYIHPRDAAKLTHAELLVIDEAAAIPLPFVQALMGPYLVFMASTINGYEGTGRSLSLKLIQKLRQQSATSSQQGASVTARTLREITLHEPIRYGLHDPIERWLYRVLCLDAATESANAPLGKTLSAGACPPPARCELFYINRDTLFSFHKASEDFLQRLMALYVSAHYKNTPNDLQLMSDAPAHHLFCLLGPVDPNEAALPEVLCVVQVCIEGEISRQTMASSLARGVRASGDLIPWMISQQFQDNEFASLSGARIVRIATHPDYSGMGYGTRALALLQKYYQGDIMGDLAEGAGSASATSKTSTSSNGSEGSSLLDERLVPRRHSAPLLSRLAERPAERLHYLGVSYGMTKQLYRFWKKNGFTPVYLRQTTNELTGEHSCIMLRELAVDPLRMTVSAPENWLNSYWLDFRKRFVSLLSISFRSFSTSTALSILERSGDASLKLAEDSVDLDASDVRRLFTVYDVKRLETYAANLVDYHIVLDLVPQLARLWFLRQLNASLTAVQCSILLGIGLQAKSIDDLEKELNLPSAQLMALFNKTVRKLTQKLRSAFEEEIAARLPTLAKQREQEVEMEPLRESVDEELSKAGESVPESTTTTSTASKGPKLPFSDAVSLSQYAIDGTDEAWTEALATGSASVVSVKGEKRKKRLENEAERNSDLKRLRKSEEDTGISGYVPKKKKSKSKK